MRFLLPLLLVALIALAVWFAVRAVKARNQAACRWEVKQLDKGQDTLIWLIKGSERDLIDSVNRMLDDYDDRVLAAKVEAEDKMMTRNAILDSTPRRQLEG